MVRTAGHLGGWDSYPKQIGQIRSEWRERSWKPSRADPVLRLSHIPPHPSLSSPSPFSPFHHRPASSFPHLACHKSHFSLFFKQYRHVSGGGSALMVFLLLCGVPPPVLDFTASPPPRLSRTSVKWGQHLPCNAVSFLCFSAAL